MLWKLLAASFLIGSACAAHLEYLKIDSDEELFDGSLDSEVLPMSEAQLPGVCWVCNWAMNKVKKQLGNNTSQETIKRNLSNVCNSVGFLRGLCKWLLNKYMDTLVEELSTTDNPRTICENINVCTRKGVLERTKAFL